MPYKDKAKKLEWQRAWNHANPAAKRAYYDRYKAKHPAANPPSVKLSPDERRSKKREEERLYRSRHPDRYLASQRLKRRRRSECASIIHLQSIAHLLPPA